MNLLFLTVRSDFGGGPRHVDQLVKGLPDGCEIYMAYPEEGDPYAEMWKIDKRIKGAVFIPYRKFSLATLWQLRQFVKENAIDIIHSHGNGAGLYSRLLKLTGIKTKVVHTFHGISDEYSSKFKYLMSLVVGRFLESLADVYIAVSNGEKALGVKRGFCTERNCVVVYNGIADEKIRAAGFDSRTIVTLSRYDYQKNMSLCLDIVRLMKNEGYRFLWVGDGEDFATMKDAVEKEQLPVDMVGFQTKPMKYLTKSAVYLSTSRFEGLPYALIEASSIGLPIVATDVKGNNEVAINGENGLTFKTAEEGAAALRRILNDKQEYERMSINSRKLFEEKFTIDVMINNLTKIYKVLA